MVAVVKPGTMLFEIEGVSESLAKECLRLAATKLPIRLDSFIEILESKGFK